MMTFNVNVARLIATLEGNRTKHAADYQAAIVKYREKALEWFEANLEIVRKGGQIEHNLRIPIPEEHTEDFDRAIEALTWHTEEEIELVEQQFDELVRNQWGWHRTFIQNTTSYLAS